MPVVKGGAVVVLAVLAVDVFCKGFSYIIPYYRIKSSEHCQFRPVADFIVPERLI